MTKKFLSILALGSLVLASASTVQAQPKYPVRPVQVVVPYSAGGGTDLATRVMAESLKKHMGGANVIVKNQPGGGGAIGVSGIIHAKADGYTIGMGAQGPLSMLPHYGGHRLYS